MHFTEEASVLATPLNADDEIEKSKTEKLADDVRAQIDRLPISEDKKRDLYQKLDAFKGDPSALNGLSQEVSAKEGEKIQQSIGEGVGVVLGLSAIAHGPEAFNRFAHLDAVVRPHGMDMLHGGIMPIVVSHGNDAPFNTVTAGQAVAQMAAIDKWRDEGVAVPARQKK